MEAKKAILRTEDMEKGMFYIAGSVPQQEPQKGISQEELAVRLNVVRQTISKWEKGVSHS